MYQLFFDSYIWADDIINFTDECSDALSCEVQDEVFPDRGAMKCPKCKTDEKQKKQQQYRRAESKGWNGEVEEEEKRWWKSEGCWWWWLEGENRVSLDCPG